LPKASAKPLTEDILPGPPPELKARLLDAFDIQIFWKKPGRQATVFAEITDATLRALPAILNLSQDGYDDTSEPASDESVIVEDLFEAPIVHRTIHEARINHANRGMQSTGLNRSHHPSSCCACPWTGRDQW